MVDKLLEVDRLSVSFLTESGYVAAVRDVSLHVDEGEVLAVVGESGSGKSVMALAVMGLHGANTRVEGTVRFAGEALGFSSPGALRRLRGDRIAMIFQDPMTALNPLMTIGEQVTEAIQVHRPVARDTARARVVELLDRVGIPEPERRADQYPHEFSGGMCQRAMIAMAIANEPRLLIADEPTTALDVTVQAQVMEVMREIRELSGAAMLLITHDLGLVAGSADRVAVMYGGRVQETAEAMEIFYRTRHPYTRGLMRSIPIRGRAEHRLAPIPGSPPSLAQVPPGCAFAPRCPQADAECTRTAPELLPVSVPGDGGGGGTAHLARCRREAELDDWDLELV